MINKFSNFFSKKNDSEIDDYYSPDDLNEPQTILPTEKELKQLRKENILLKKSFFEQSLESFKTRRSVRKFSNKEIDDKIVLDIIEGSLNAPAAGNIQNYKIIVVKDHKRKCEVGKISLNQCWMSEAPVLLVVVRDDSKVVRMYPQDGTRYSMQNSASFIENLLMLTHASGLASCWVEACENDVLKEYLGVPSPLSIDAILPIGYSLENPKVQKESCLDMVYFENFRNRDK
jgi:nitroreductase